MKQFTWQTSKRLLRRIVRDLLASVLVGLVLVLVAGSVFFSWQRARLHTEIAAGDRLPQALATAKSAGLTLATAELQVPLPPSSQNAALVYVRLKQRLKQKPLTPGQEILSPFEPESDLTTADAAHIAVVLKQRSELLALAHQAAACPQCVFARDWKTAPPENILFPEYVAVRQTIRLLTAQSMVMAHQGRFLEAIKNQTLGFQIARHAASDRILISYVVANAMDTRTIEGLGKIVQMSHGSPMVAAAVQSVIEREWKHRSLAAALKYQVAMSQGEIDYLLKTGPTDIGDVPGDRVAMVAMPISPNPRQDWNTMLAVNDAYMLKEMSRAIAVADQPYQFSYGEFQTLKTDRDPEIQRGLVLAYGLCPIDPHLAVRRAQIQALVNVDCAGCAVLVAQEKTGKLPDHVPGTFADPFTDKPLEYRREGKSGFVVYSAGPRGDFDGGKPGVKAKNSQTYFRYPAIPEK